uniref:E3 ubiquitin-protein ligase PPP1R11 n=1 Tax=Capra hircus TaxID=9925 RepID=A0A8C2PKH3_CAPHI
MDSATGRLNRVQYPAFRNRPSSNLHRGFLLSLCVARPCSHCSPRLLLPYQSDASSAKVVSPPCGACALSHYGGTNPATRRFDAFSARKGKGGPQNASHPETSETQKRQKAASSPFLRFSLFSALAMAEAGAGLSETVTETTVTVTTEPENRSLTIKLRKRKPEKKVEWTSDTVDNEHMGRRSSKCCCIYEKPRAFGESSTESDDEEEEGCGHTHCVRGHRKGRRHATPGPSPTTPPQPPDPSQPPPGPMQH